MGNGASASAKESGSPMTVAEESEPLPADPPQSIKSQRKNAWDNTVQLHDPSDSPDIEFATLPFDWKSGNPNQKIQI